MFGWGPSRRRSTVGRWSRRCWTIRRWSKKTRVPLRVFDRLKMAAANTRRKRRPDVLRFRRDRGRLRFRRTGGRLSLHLGFAAVVQPVKHAVRSHVYVFVDDERVVQQHRDQCPTVDSRWDGQQALQVSLQVVGQPSVHRRLGRVLLRRQPVRDSQPVRLGHGQHGPHEHFDLFQFFRRHPRGTAPGRAPTSASQRRDDQQRRQRLKWVHNNIHYNIICRTSCMAGQLLNGTSSAAVYPVFAVQVRVKCWIGTRKIEWRNFLLLEYL